MRNGGDTVMRPADAEHHTNTREQQTNQAGNELSAQAGKVAGERSTVESSMPNGGP